MFQKAKFYFGLSKIERKGAFTRIQIAQLLFKWVNMAEKWEYVKRPKTKRPNEKKFNIVGQKAE